MAFWFQQSVIWEGIWWTFSVRVSTQFIKGWESGIRRMKAVKSANTQKSLINPLFLYKSLVPSKLEYPYSIQAWRPYKFLVPETCMNLRQFFDAKNSFKFLVPNSWAWVTYFSNVWFPSEMFNHQFTVLQNAERRNVIIIIVCINTMIHSEWREGQNPLHQFPLSKSPSSWRLPTCLMDFWHNKTWSQ